MIADTFVSVEERMPTKTGWYEVKTKHGYLTDAPLSKTALGKLIWVVPDDTIITHWLEKK